MFEKLSQGGFEKVWGNLIRLRQTNLLWLVCKDDTIDPVLVIFIKNYFSYAYSTSPFLHFHLWFEQVAVFVRLSRDKNQQIEGTTSGTASHYTSLNKYTAGNFCKFWTMQYSTCGMLLPDRFHSTPRSYWSQSTEVSLLFLQKDSIVFILLNVVLVLYQDKIMTL